MTNEEMENVVDIREILASKFPLRKAGPGEYVNPADGLVYCSVCDEPRMRENKIGEHTCYFPKRCRCEREKFEKQREEREHREALETISRLKSGGLQDRALHKYCFRNDKGYNPKMSVAHEYVRNWKEMEKKGTGLLLWGPVGTGKTFFAGCIANALLEMGIPVLMTTFPRIINALGSLEWRDREDYIMSFDRYRLLIIDDLGVERKTGYAGEQIFTVIDNRYRSEKPMIITTNLSLKEMRETNDLSGRRVYDRILEKCLPVMLGTRNLRSMNAGINWEEGSKLLRGEGKEKQNRPAD